MSSPLSFCEMGIFLVFFLPDVQSARGGRGSARSLYDELVAVSRPPQRLGGHTTIERAQPFSPLADADALRGHKRSAAGARYCGVGAVPRQLLKSDPQRRGKI